MIKVEARIRNINGIKANNYLSSKEKQIMITIDKAITDPNFPSCKKEIIEAYLVLR